MTPVLNRACCLHGADRPWLFSTNFEEQDTCGEYGRPFQKFDASDDFEVVRFHYNASGYLSKTSESGVAVRPPRRHGSVARSSLSGAATQYFSIAN